MPDYVLKNKDKNVGPYVLSLPAGTGDTERDAAIAALGDSWSLDTKTDPADVAAANEAVTATVTTKETK